MITSVFKIKHQRTIYILYWFLLTYIIAALVWWFIALYQQNQLMTNYKLGQAKIEQKDYNQKVDKIQKDKKRKTAQYIGEGITFFLLIIAGAVFVFRAVRTQFRQSQQQHNFMMAITHELKTPIAVTKLNLETLQKYKLAEEQQQRLIANTMQEANRLNALCNNMLLASQIEAGGYQLTSEQIDLTKLVSDAVNDFIIRFLKEILQQHLTLRFIFTGDMCFYFKWQ